MKHVATPRFWACYAALPPEIKRSADRCFELLKRDPGHPSLHFKRIGPFWSARVSLRHRALAVEHNEQCVWFWIGDHAEYDQLIQRRF